MKKKFMKKKDVNATKKNNLSTKELLARCAVIRRDIDLVAFWYHKTQRNAIYNLFFRCFLSFSLSGKRKFAAGFQLKGHAKSASNVTKSNKLEERLVNEIEAERTSGTENDLPPVDFSSLDQSCLGEQGIDNPIVSAPTIPNAISIKYAR